jgi:presequence protease
MTTLCMRARLWRPQLLLASRSRLRRPPRCLATLAKSNALTSPGDRLHGFTLEKTERFPVFDLTGYLLRHDKTGAEYLHLSRHDDPNKVFAIAFRTNPPDATGVPHILEHTTLCGSEKFVYMSIFFNFGEY